MAFRQKKRMKNSRNNYLKPGALAQIRYSRMVNRSCTNIGKKNIMLESDKDKTGLQHQEEFIICDKTPIASPMRISFQTAIEGTRTPKTPQGIDSDSQSRLESLPMDILVKVLCNLQHDQLQAVFHVSQRIREAVLLARQLHFNYITPDKSSQEVLWAKTPVPTEHWPFLSKGDWNQVLTPKAPRHGRRPPSPHLMDLRQIAGVLFQESTVHPSCIMLSALPSPVFKPVASTRVLFYEDKLCQAVIHNKLR